MDASKCKQLEALVASGLQIREAAAKVGVSESTAYKYSRTAEFKLATARIRTEATERAIGLLTDAGTLAVQTLRECMGEGHSATARIAAAKTVLSSLMPLAEHVELRQRIEDLEERALESSGQIAGPTNSD